MLSRPCLLAMVPLLTGWGLKLLKIWRRALLLGGHFSNLRRVRKNSRASFYGLVRRARSSAATFPENGNFPFA